MNGTIKCISGQTGSAAIRSAHGETFDFELTGVLAYDVAKLAEGKLVHFDLASGPSPKAINISIDPACDVSAGRKGDREIMLGSSMKATSASIVSRGSHRENRPKRS